jgi:hypothetical protein
MPDSVLASNLARVIERASAAAARAGRAPGSWRLVAVTKTVSADVAAALAALGIVDLAENRVQDLLAKMQALSAKPLRWHLIGHLQTNKVRKVVGAVSLIHSVDSLRLAGEIDKAAAAGGITQDVLLEVNVSAEESKFGLSPDDAIAVAAGARKLAHVRVLGLMTMAPIVTNPEETRPVFRGLRQLADKIASAGHFARAPYELSMGMTQDFEIAIEEGATLIRVGSALFSGM